MKKSLLIAGALFVAGAFTFISAKTLIPSKNITSVEHRLGYVDEIEVSSAISVVYVQTTDNSCRVNLSAPENLIDKVEVESRDGKLSLSLRGNLSIKGSINVKATVYAPSLTEIDLTGASSFKASSLMATGRKIEIDLSGASSLSIDKLSASTLEIDASGASAADIKNISAGILEADLSGASSVTVSGRSNNVEYEVSGASKINSAVKNVVKLESSGMSHVRNNND